MKTLFLCTVLLLPLVCTAQTVSPNSASPISAQLVDPATGSAYSAGGADTATPAIYSPNFQAPASIMLIDPANGQAYKATGGGSGPTLQTNGTNNTIQTTLNLQNGQGVVITNPSGGNVQIASTVPQRTVTTSPTVASTDMGGVIIMNVTGGGTLTVPAISSTVLASGMSVGVVNYSASTAAVSTTPTINSGGGCVTATGIPSGDTWQLISNGTTLDCIQTAPTNASSQIIGVSSGFLTPSATQYQGFFAGNMGNSEPSQVAPRSGVVANLYVSGPTLAAATSLQVTLRDNATSESVTCTIAAGTNNCNDTTHTFTFATGDKLDWQTVQTGTGTAGTYTFICTVQ